MSPPILNIYNKLGYLGYFLSNSIIFVVAEGFVRVRLGVISPDFL